MTPTDRPPRGLMGCAFVVVAFVLGVYVGYNVCYREFTGHFTPPGDFGPDMEAAKKR